MANFGKAAGGGGTHTLTAGSDFVSGPTCVDEYYGFSSTGVGGNPSFGSISPGTLSGFTITQLHFSKIFEDFGFGCQLTVDGGFTFSVSGYSGTKTGLFTSVTYQSAAGGTTTLTSSGATSYVAGIWFWGAGTGSTEPTSGAVTFV